MPPNIHTVPSSGLSQLVGIQRVVRVPAPAAGADWTFTVGDGFYWRLLGGSGLFTTSAAVVNRFVGLQLTDGTNILAFERATQAATAGLAMRVGIRTFPIGYASSVASLSLPLGTPAAWMPSGYTIGTSTLNIDVADQWSAVVLWWECLDYGAYGIPEGVHAPTDAEHDLITEHS